MAIEINENFKGRTSKIGIYLIREHGRSFVAQTTANEQSYAVLAHSDCPKIGDRHPDDSVSLCVDVNAKPGTAPNVLMVFAKYTNDLPDDTIEEDDPTGVRPVTTWGAQDFTRSIIEDRNGDPILNKAGDRYDDPLDLVETFPTLNISRAQSSFSVTRAFAYNNATNSDVYKGAQPGTMRVLITAVEEWKDDTPYWKVNYSFTYNPNGWQPRILEAGLNQLYYITGPTPATVKVPCTLKGVGRADSLDVDHPVPIDANGVQIPSDTLFDTPNPVVYTEWEIFEPLPFLALGV